MKMRCLCAFVLLTIAASAFATSFRDDSRYVARGPRTGYYIIRPGSVLIQQLGLQGAPFRDTSDPLNHGRGADVLAFRLNTAGMLSVPPAYIVQGQPNDFYIRRIDSFIRGRTTTHDVESFFGRPKQIEKRRDGIIAYYTIEVYNPFEETSGGRR
ncbi:MAG: hypothetical protein ABJB70_00315 [Candidatus Udaeobacter sp.]